jgi:hypothetical protein
VRGAQRTASASVLEGGCASWRRADPVRSVRDEPFLPDHLLVQLETPDDIRGRVSAVNSVFIGASNELGEFESGMTASWWGTVTAVVVGGIATMGVAVAWARLFPALRRLDRFPGARDHIDPG